ncbi:MAG: CS domain-containing protein [Methanoregula sp.]|jgi:HSP20 family molecular chaperone IbpA
MQNNPNGPYDDVFSNLAKIVEDIVKSMPESENARIVGYTIITRQPSSDDSCMCHFDSAEDDDDILYEVMESDDQVFITATLPADLKNAPYADIEPDRVSIIADDKSVTITLDNPVDRIHSYYRVHRGVLDITLKKAKPIQ